MTARSSVEWPEGAIWNLLNQKGNEALGLFLPRSGNKSVQTILPSRHPRTVVPLRGLYARVAEQSTDFLDGHAFLEQANRERIPQTVRREIGCFPKRVAKQFPQIVLPVDCSLLSDERSQRRDGKHVSPHDFLYKPR
jgi:hypothetical protein